MREPRTAAGPGALLRALRGVKTETWTRVALVALMLLVIKQRWEIESVRGSDASGSGAGLLDAQSAASSRLPSWASSATGASAPKRGGGKSVAVSVTEEEEDDSGAGGGASDGGGGDGEDGEEGGEPGASEEESAGAASSRAAAAGNRAAATTTTSAGGAPQPEEVDVPVTISEMTREQRPASSGPRFAAADASKSVLTIVTGTHVAPGLDAAVPPLSQQHKLCSDLAGHLHKLWTAWESVTWYVGYKSKVKAALRNLASAKVSCTLSGWKNVDWTFPMRWKPSYECDSRTRKMLDTKSYLKEQTKVYVNWALIRPDLVTLHNLAVVEGVEPRFVVVVGHDHKSAAMEVEGCPRFNTLLEKRDVYKQRMLLVALSDIQHQLGRVRGNAWKVHVCSAGSIRSAGDSGSAASSSSSSSFFASATGQASAGGGGASDAGSHLLLGPAKHSWFDAPPAPDSLKCQARAVDPVRDRTHMGSMLMMRLFHPQNENLRVPKTVFEGPRLVFVAGLEGVGHHVFSLLGKKHTTRALYEALTDVLSDAAWDDDSETKYAAARERLVQAMAALRKDPALLHKDGSKVVFLNTVWVERDVNMYSLPWGGPRCFLKRYARVVCNVDVVELAKAAEEAKIDFRIVLLRRAIGAAVVSASLHRPFGTLVSETRTLALSWALLKSSVETLDPRFVLDVTYEDLMNHPAESARRLAEHFGVDAKHPLTAHMEQTLAEGGAEHPVGDGSKWREEVDLEQLQFMTDILDMTA